MSVGKAGSILVDRILFCHEASIASCNFCSLPHVPCIVFTTHANITLGSHHGFGTLSMFERLTDGIKSQLSPGDDHSTLDVRTCCSLWYVYAGVRRSFFSLFDEQTLLGIDLHPADDIDGVTGAGAGLSGFRSLQFTSPLDHSESFGNGDMEFTQRPATQHPRADTYIHLRRLEVWTRKITPPVYVAMHTTAPHCAVHPRAKPRCQSCERA